MAKIYLKFTLLKDFYWGYLQKALFVTIMRIKLKLTTSFGKLMNEKSSEFDFFAKCFFKLLRSLNYFNYLL